MFGDEPLVIVVIVGFNYPLVTAIWTPCGRLFSTPLTPDSLPSMARPEAPREPSRPAISAAPTQGPAEN